ncbi:class I SAM-dependent methyltransferase [Achromobacter deleyi]|uniref:class I SAM-dependent methyltransferase n=1 Tax=Achromobacter deleyi TaxID=1353891 RepID=UPI001490D5F4|nr:class I SAM-dependent methyltransferase [Achromobacter deleyi]QVQ28767.1 class I SAM-dependent methyltransferase [Achromobacter deleyi]UIP18883.1 class I SAM-dependent methyltransferase [Achromobacter deleyi]
MNHLKTTFFGLRDTHGFVQGIQQALNNLNGAVGVYAGDNLFTYHRNLSFLGDESLMRAFKQHATTEIEQAVLWRMSVVLWGVRNGLRLDGDFVECACYKGTTARVVSDAVDLGSYPDRHYYLYDLFDHDPSLPHHAMPEHSKQLFAQVKQRFSDLSNVTVTQGKVPEILAEVAPEKIAFMHLDLNNADAEVGALDVLFDRMVPGAVLILDDYGWLGYKEQKEAEDPWFAKRGYQVLELPTGQGMVIK